MLIASMIIVIIELKKGYYGEKFLLSCLFWLVIITVNSCLKLATHCTIITLSQF